LWNDATNIAIIDEIRIVVFWKIQQTSPQQITHVKKIYRKDIRVPFFHDCNLNTIEKARIAVVLAWGTFSFNCLVISGKVCIFATKSQK